MDRADGRDADPGAVHRAGMDLRAQARRHSAARVQERDRTCGCCRATVCPRTIPAVAEAIANLPVHDVILDGEVTWDEAGRRTTSSTSCGSTAATSRRCRSTSVARCSTALPFRPPLERVVRARRREALGAGVQRGMGRRHREAARFAVRASPLAALAEDEVRGFAGARGRRVHRSAGRTRRPRRAAGRLLRGRRFRLRRQSRHGASTRSCCWSCARGSTRSRSPKSPFTRAVGLAARSRALGAARDRRAGRVHRVDGARQASPLPAARRPHRQAAREVVRETRDHPSREGAVPGRRHHQGRARGVLRGDRAAHAAAHPRAAGHDGALSIAASARRASFRRTCRRASPHGWSGSRCRRKAGRCTTRSCRDTRSLLWLANQNCITPHVWTSRAPNLYQPDICVFDLDPVGGRAGGAAGRGARRFATCCSSWV